MKAPTITGQSKPKKTTVYAGFKGVDYSVDASLVDKSRSPFAPNLISDIGGLPEKRLGWRTLHQLEGPVNGLFYGEIDGVKTFIAHGGTKLYKWTDQGYEVIREGVSNSKSTAFFLPHEGKGKLWILTGAEYLCYDGTSIQDVCELATTPVILIGKKPSGGGTPFESVNLLTPKRTEKFGGTATDTIYQLSTDNLDETPVTVRKVTASGLQDLIENTDFTVDRIAGRVTFTVAPGAPVVTGEDNVYITYAKTVEGYADRIKKCQTFAYYGLGGSNRVFVTGNPDFPPNDWYCELNDPTYFPDLGYTIVGNPNTAVMGYAKLGKYLLIIKEDNRQDSTIFLRNAELLNGVAAFPTEQGVAGIGAIARRSFVSLIDEPLFLSRTGVYAITSNIITAERTVQNRSYYVDSKLTKEESLENTVAVEWNGYAVFAVNSRCYILDGKQNKSYKPQSNAEYVYECYQWENVPAVCFLEHDGELYFGTGDGRVCKFNTDIPTMERFNDDSQPVIAAWATKNDNDGATYLLKTMVKKGGMVTIKPFLRSSAKVLVRADGEAEREIRYDTMDIFSWEDIDFDRITFSSNESPQEIFFNVKVKKYKRLQIIVRNEGLSEGFGVFEIAKTYTVGNYAKR